VGLMNMLIMLDPSPGSIWHHALYNRTITCQLRAMTQNKMNV